MLPKGGKVAPTVAQDVAKNASGMQTMHQDDTLGEKSLVWLLYIEKVDEQFQKDNELGEGMFFQSKLISISLAVWGHARCLLGAYPQPPAGGRSTATTPTKGLLSKPSQPS